ncbi:MAG: hypothetical protein IT463_06030 [Planctomycetes bacterium]|nr:hypothetical protein [Planctomycetota bacterium]
MNQPDDPLQQLQSARPAELRETAPVKQALEALAARVRERDEALARAEAERLFLERAAAEGLQHTADALKLAAPHETLAGAPDKQVALRELFARLRSERPWLFAPPRDSPGAEKLVPARSPDLERLRQAYRGGALTRQVQIAREGFRVRRPGQP